MSVTTLTEQINRFKSQYLLVNYQSSEVQIPVDMNLSSSSSSSHRFGASQAADNSPPPRRVVHEEELDSPRNPEDRKDLKSSSAESELPLSPSKCPRAPLNAAARPRMKAKTAAAAAAAAVSNAAAAVSSAAAAVSTAAASVSTAAAAAFSNNEDSSSDEESHGGRKRSASMRVNEEASDVSAADNEIFSVDSSDGELATKKAKASQETILMVLQIISEAIAFKLSTM